MKPFLILLHNYDLLKTTTLTDIKQRYAGSIFGIFWLFLYPLVMMAIYLVVYVVIFKVRPLGMTLQEYVLHIFSGLVPFLFISEVLAGGTTSISANKELLKSTSFPIEIIPIKVVITSFINFFVGLFFVILASVIMFPENIYLLLLPFLFLIQLWFLIGINWFTSVLSLIFRDLQNIIPLFVMVLMVSSPIAYVVDMVPEEIQFLVYANPFSYFIVMYQDVIAHRSMPSLIMLAGTTGISLFIYIAGFKFFNKVKEIVSNYA